jgi:hypothetical protein
LCFSSNHRGTMELLFESRICVGTITGKMSPVQGRATLHEEPVLVGDTEADGAGASIYGSVMHDGGCFRMWYQAWPRDWSGPDVALVGYAESDDGIEWRKPNLTVPDTGGPTGNLTNLGFHSPSVFIDPASDSETRYRATGCAKSEGVRVRGYYTSHSSDGLNWELDSNSPAWPGADVISSIYHPGREKGLVALKQTVRYRSVPRRSIWTAGFENGVWTREHRALVPDDFDDVCALTRGFASADYYGMGMQAASQSAVGFIWQFRHSLPRTPNPGWESGIFGAVGVTLAFQDREGDCWQHAAGRADFIPHDALPWAEGGFYSASGAIECGDEHRLYLCGARHTHGWYLDSRWKRLDRWKAVLQEEGLARITFARWPKWRLFGFRADPEGTLDLHLDGISEASRLCLNFECDRTGSIRVEVLDDAERNLDASVPMTGSSLARKVAWRGTDLLRADSDGGRITVRLHLERATVWAFETRPVS